MRGSSGEHSAQLCHQVAPKHFRLGALGGAHVLDLDNPSLQLFAANDDAQRNVVLLAILKKVQRLRCVVGKMKEREDESHCIPETDPVA